MAVSSKGGLRIANLRNLPVAVLSSAKAGLSLWIDGKTDLNTPDANTR
jgi:hypothetical protein